MPHKDPEQRRAYERERKKHPTKRRSDKYYTAARHANERAARLGIPGQITTADARTVLDGAPCHYCGTDVGPIGLDHVIAMAVGGPNDIKNLVPACQSCNASKHVADRPPRWSRKHDACVECGTTDKPHVSGGRCSPCYWRDYEAAHPDRPRGGQRSRVPEDRDRAA